MISFYRMALLQVLDMVCLVVALTISGLTTIEPGLNVFDDYTGASLFTAITYLPRSAFSSNPTASQPEKLMATYTGVPSLANRL